MTVIKIQDHPEVKRRKAEGEVPAHPDPGQDQENVHPEEVDIGVGQSVVDPVQMRVVVVQRKVDGRNPDPDLGRQEDKIKSRDVIEFNKNLLYLKKIH